MGIYVDLILENGFVYSKGRFHETHLAIKDGKIHSLGQQGLTAKKVLDAQGLHILPGVIDTLCSDGRSFCCL